MLEKNIRFICKILRWSTDGMAVKASISFKAMRNFLRGISNLSPEDIERIAHAFNLTPEELTNADVSKFVAKNVAKNVRYLMEKRGWSQNRLATKSNVSVMGICSIIYNEITPSPDSLHRLALALGTAEKDLCFGNFVPVVKKEIAKKTFSSVQITEENQSNLAKNIRSLLKEKGMTFLELSLRADLSLSTIYYIIDGSRKPRSKTLRKLSNALGVTPEELVR